MNINRKYRGFFLILILGLLTAIGPLSIDLYLPAFPQIADSLSTDIAVISYSLSSFFVGLAIGQLISGPMLERFGRKKPVYAGMVLYIAATIGCAFAGSVEELIVYRFLQAVGGCAGLVAARAIIRDLFRGKTIAKVFSMLIMVVAISPIIAPTLGGFLSTHFGWRSVFYMLIFLSALILLGAVLILPESKPPNKDYSLRIPSLVRNYISIFKHPVFFIYAFTGAMAYAGLYAYISGSPYLYMHLFGLNEQQYGWVFAIIAGGLISATQINRYLLQKYSSVMIIHRALIIQSGVALVLLATTILGIEGLIIDTILIFGFLFFLGFIFPNASAMSLEPMGHTAGNASALMGGIQMTVGAGASALVGALNAESSLSMVMVMTFFAFMSLALFLTGRKFLSLRHI